MLELLALLTAASLALIYISTILIVNDRRMPIILILAGLLLLGSGLTIAAEGLQIQTGTLEYSFYWNCSLLKGNCSGTPSQDACTPYDQYQCEHIPGCQWAPAPDNCTGTPTVTCEWLGAYDIYGNKCQETDGCTWSSDLADGTCDQVIINNTYQNLTGNWTTPNTNTDILYYIYILGGIFFIIWGAVSIWEREPEEEEE